MKIPKGTFKAWIGGYLRVTSLPLLPRRSEKRTLLILAPVSVPGLGMLLSLSHDREKVKWHLLVKHVLEGLNEHERIVFILLTTPGSEEEYRFFKEVMEFDFLSQPIGTRMAWLKKMSDHVSLMRPNPTLCLTGLEPTLSFNRFWFEEKKFPPVRRMGVGYKDQGSLRPATLGVVGREEPPKDSIFPDLMLSFRIFFRLPLIPENLEGSPSSSSKARIRLKSPGRAK